MNFLEGVQRLRQECSVSGNGPSNVEGQVGEMQRLVNWYQAANIEICSKYFDWRFLWMQDSLTLIPNQSRYLGNVFPADLRVFDTNRFKIEDVPVDYVIEYAEYDNHEYPVPGIISRIIIMPDNGLLLDPAPNQAYELSYDYYRSPTPLVVNTDESDIPDQFQAAIIGRAMMFYANYESAGEMKIQGQEMYAFGLRQLEQSQLPNYSNTYGLSDHDTIVIRPE